MRIGQGGKTCLLCQPQDRDQSGRADQVRVIEGLIITILVLTGFRQAVFHAVPPQLKTAISVGIGLFIAVIGFVDAGFVRKSFGGPLGELGVGGFLVGWPLLVCVLGLFSTVVLLVRKVRGAILYGILSATVLAIIVESIGKIGAQKNDLSLIHS